MVLVACGKSESDKTRSSNNTNSETPQAEFVRDISGVWSGDNGGLITIDYRDNEFRLVIDDEPKFVKLGDIDLTNETINLLLKRTSDKKSIIWTVRRLWDENKTSFHLELTLDDGSREELSFVRKVTTDDINRLANLYARNGTEANVGAAGTNVQTSGEATQPTDSPDTTSDSEALAVVRNFYAALAQGNGDQASGMVVLEKRESGPFSAAELSKFYSSLKEPIHLVDAHTLSDSSVSVRYHFVFSDGRVCNGGAIVRTDNEDGATLIATIHTDSGC